MSSVSEAYSSKGLTPRAPKASAIPGDFSSKGSYTVPKTTCAKRVFHFLFTSDMPYVTSAFGALFRAATGIAKQCAEVSKSLRIFIDGTQFTTVWTLPIDLVWLIDSLSRAIFTGEKEERVDAWLDFSGKVVAIGDGISNFVAGLVDVGAVAAQAMVWAAPLCLACSLAGVVFSVINARGIHNNRKFSRSFKKCKTPSDVLALVKKHDYRLKKHAGVNATKFANKINDLQTKGASDQKIKRAYEALKRRITWKQVNHSLGFVITGIGMIASIILFASPAAPACVIAGSTLLVALYLISVSRMGIDLGENWRFNRSMRLT